MIWGARRRVPRNPQKRNRAGNRPKNTLRRRLPHPSRHAIALLNEVAAYREARRPQEELFAIREHPAPILFWKRRLTHIFVSRPQGWRLTSDLRIRQAIRLGPFPQN